MHERPGWGAINGGRCREQQPRDGAMIRRGLGYEQVAGDGAPVLPAPGWARTVGADGFRTRVKCCLWRHEGPGRRALLLLTAIDLYASASDWRQGCD